MIGGVVTKVAVAEGEPVGVTVNVPVGVFDGVGVTVNVPVGVASGEGEPVAVRVGVKLGVATVSVPVGAGEAVGGNVAGVELTGNDVPSGGAGEPTGVSGIGVAPGYIPPGPLTSGPVNGFGSIILSTSKYHAVPGGAPFPHPIGPS